MSTLSAEKGVKEPPHAIHQVRIGRFQHQMKMVAGKGSSLHVARCLSYSKAPLGWVTTRLLPRDVLAPVSPAHDVVHGTGILDAQLPRHVLTLPSTTRAVECKRAKWRLDPFPFPGTANTAGVAGPGYAVIQTPAQLRAGEPAPRKPGA